MLLPSGFAGCRVCQLTPIPLAAPLLPQLYVAKRDGAKNIFKQYLDSQGGQLRVRAWIGLGGQCNIV